MLDCSFNELQIRVPAALHQSEHKVLLTSFKPVIHPITQETPGALPNQKQSTLETGSEYSITS